MYFCCRRHFFRHGTGDRLKDLWIRFRAIFFFVHFCHARIFLFSSARLSLAVTGSEVLSIALLSPVSVSGSLIDASIRDLSFFLLPVLFIPAEMILTDVDPSGDRSFLLSVDGAMGLLDLSVWSRACCLMQTYLDRSRKIYPGQMMRLYCFRQMVRKAGCKMRSCLDRPEKHYPWQETYCNGVPGDDWLMVAGPGWISALVCCSSGLPESVIIGWLFLWLVIGWRLTGQISRSWIILTIALKQQGSPKNPRSKAPRMIRILLFFKTEGHQAMGRRLFFCSGDIFPDVWGTSGWKSPNCFFNMVIKSRMIQHTATFCMAIICFAAWSGLYQLAATGSGYAEHLRDLFMAVSFDDIQVENQAVSIWQAVDHL